jgi:uncharacterized protein
MRLRAVCCLMLLALAGCGQVSRLTGSTFHQKVGWKAKDYFDDPKAIALCHAIEADDLAEIDRLVAAGANVNTRGKDNMTPLLWAYPDDKLARFTRLLELGANPNIAITSGLGRSGFGAGDSVTHMACRTRFPGYFEAVFEHGGDPKLIQNGRITGITPIHSVITGGGPNKREHVRLLIDQGADLNHMNGAWATPVIEAVSWGGQYDIALMLLQAGADHTIYVPKSNTRLIHILVMEEDPTPNKPHTAMTRQARKSTWTPQQESDFKTLVKWLEDHGESFQDARADVARWQSWDLSAGEYRRKMDAEIAERVARETQANQQPPDAAK